MKFELRKAELVVEGQPVALREIPAPAMMRLAKQFTSNGQQIDQPSWVTAVIAASVVNVKGERFLDSEAGLAEISEWPLRAYNQIADAALEVNGLDNERKKN